MAHVAEADLEPRLERPLVLAVLFVISGAAGLIYEVVWFRMLIRLFGITVFATSTILVVYMAGLAAGSLLGGRQHLGSVSGSSAPRLGLFHGLNTLGAVAGVCGAGFLLLGVPAGVGLGSA